MSTQAEETLVIEGAAPKEILFDSLVVDVVFHPDKEVIASCTIDGDVYIHSYSTETENRELMKLSHHTKACRGLSFSKDGSFLFSISKDKSLQAADMETGSIVNKIAKAHSHPIYSLVVIDDYLVATGDDEGYLKVWDFRKQFAVMEFKQTEEYISDLKVKDRMLLATSGEGTLTAFNIRRKQLELQSELFESEFLCLDIVKDKVVVGNGDGTLNIFNWGEWGNISDMFPGHPGSIDSIINVNQDIVCTGCSDGAIRAINILPNRFMGIVGRHKDFPVESLSISGDILASCSHDQKVCFWNISSLDDVDQVDPSSKASREKKTAPLNESAKNFFDDLKEK